MSLQRFPTLFVVALLFCFKCSSSSFVFDHPLDLSELQQVDLQAIEKESQEEHFVHDNHRDLQTQNAAIIRLEAYDRRSYKLLERNVTAGAVFSLPVLGLSQVSDLAFIAVTNTATKAVVFGLNSNANYNTERGFPLTLCRDDGKNLFPCRDLKIGMNTITMTPYSSSLLTGPPGPVVRVPITITTTRPAPVKAPVPVPMAKAPVPVPTNRVPLPVPVPANPTVVRPPVTSGIGVLRIEAYQVSTKRLLVGNVLDQTVLSMNLLGIKNPSDITFVAVPSAGTKWVMFGLNNVPNFQRESTLPFVLCRDDLGKGTFLPCTSLKLGVNNLTVTPYGPGPNGQEIAGPIARIQFTITNSVPAPVSMPVIASVPVPVPVSPPVPVPVPVTPPVPVPVKATVPVPVPASVTAPASDPRVDFVPIRINCGSYQEPYVDALAERWVPDDYFSGGLAPKGDLKAISGTTDDILFQYFRTGPDFSYKIPVRTKEAKYEVNLYFADTVFTTIGKRVFDISVENEVRPNTDILTLGIPLSASRVQFFPVVKDGFVDIRFWQSSSTPTVGVPLVSAIEVKDFTEHIAHAVASGPYTGTVTNEVLNKATIRLSGETSHTHGDNLNLVGAQWKEGDKVLGNALEVSYDFTPGEHVVSLTVKDTGGFVDKEVTVVDIKPYGYPAITKITPNTCDLVGNTAVTIQGSGFTFPTNQIKVQFGATELTGAQLTVINPTTMIVKCPPAKFAQPIDVRIVTPLAESEKFPFTYKGTAAINFKMGQLFQVKGPTVARFGPDQNLYVGTRWGELCKMTLNSDFTVVTNTVVVIGCNEGKLSMALMGIAFDPLDTKENPNVYYTCSRYYHAGFLSTSGTTINGRIMMASGALMETRTNIITGLPISDLDHGLNAMEFGDQGELYFTQGSLTNAGIPGQLSRSSGKLKESFFSCSINVAYISAPGFDGNIKYTADDDGSPIVKGVEIFAPGSRNPYSIMLHSNGNLYATDNGPNKNYGRMSTGCGPNDSIDDEGGRDKINHIVKGNYYGSPNRKRAEYFNDPRQCVWENPSSTNTKGGAYKPAILIHPSSINGLFEFHGNHFDGQLRRNLIYARYNSTKGLFRAILNEDGTGMVPSSKESIPMFIGEGGLEATQAPNGNIIEVHYLRSMGFYHEPVEAPTTNMIVKAVFPRRGTTLGGNTLSIYGVNFNVPGNLTPTVMVGNKMCPVLSVTPKKIACKLPGGTGTVDITVTYGNGITSTFDKGYRYVLGTLPINFKLPEYK